MMTRDAFDIIERLTEAGTTLYVRNGTRLTWECDRRRPVPADLLAELPRHKSEVIAILLDIPPGCPVPEVCRCLGICHREIRDGACTRASPALGEREGGEAA